MAGEIPLFSVYYTPKHICCLLISTFSFVSNASSFWGLCGVLQNVCLILFACFPTIFFCWFFQPRHANTQHPRASLVGTSPGPTSVFDGKDMQKLWFPIDFPMKTMPFWSPSRHTDFYGLKVLVEPVRAGWPRHHGLGSLRVRFHSLEQVKVAKRYLDLLVVPFRYIYRYLWPSNTLRESFST